MNVFTNENNTYGYLSASSSSSNAIKIEHLEDVSEKIKKHFKICRLCLLEIRNGNITFLEGIIKDMLEIILPELKIFICESPAICDSCLTTLKQSYNFKSSCLEVEDHVQDFVNPKIPHSVDLKQVLRKKNSRLNILDGHVICRTCLGLEKETSCTKLGNYEGDPLQNMMEKCLPEMGVRLTKDPFLCTSCLEQLEEYFNFIMQCLDTEEKIKYYCEIKNVYKEISLSNVLSFSMCIDDSEELGKQYEDIECVESTSFERKYVDNNYIETQLKDENDVNQLSEREVLAKAEYFEEPDITCDVSEIKKINTQKLFPNSIQLSKSVPKESVTFQISKDSNGEEIITSETSQNCEQDSRDDSDLSVTSESEVLAMRYVEDVNVDNTSRKTKPKNYKGKVKREVRKEKVIYKDDDENEVESSEESKGTAKRRRNRKCQLCNFKSNCKAGMKIHMTTKHSENRSKTKPEGDVLIKCRRKNCTFKTTVYADYKKHSMEHKSERQKICPVCKMVFCRQDFFDRHVASHKTPQSKMSHPKQWTERSPGKIIKATKYNFNGQFLKMFKCQFCPYQTRSRYNLTRHTRIHKKTSEMKIYKCEVCNFETIQKENYSSHMQNHNNSTQTQIKKCFLCSFQPKTEEALRKHVEVVHKSGTG